MSKITEWTAKRSGVNLTVAGKRDGELVKIFGVVRIEGSANGIHAICADGTRLELGAR